MLLAIFGAMTHHRAPEDPFREERAIQARGSRWAYSSLKNHHPCQPSPIPLSGLPTHRPFRGLLGVHSRCGLHTRAVTKVVTAIRGPQTFRRLHACPGCFPAGAIAGRGLHPLEMRRLVTAHVETSHYRYVSSLTQFAESRPSHIGDAQPPGAGSC